ncbi:MULTISPECIES: hypothetical protein [Methylobacterium]|uniref:hypothetical protein n=1 Tax=Methylobacterium TaxID=407 RepID=UPI001AEEB797|nr:MULTISPECIES: hypothetical protein [Methylobacterium]
MKGLPRSVAMNVSAPTGEAAIDVASGARMGAITTMPVFSVRMVNSPFGQRT